MQVWVRVTQHRVVDLEGFRHPRHSLPKDDHVFQECVSSRTPELVQLPHVITREEQRVAAEKLVIPENGVAALHLGDERWILAARGECDAVADETCAGIASGRTWH